MAYGIDTAVTKIEEEAAKTTGKHFQNTARWSEAICDSHRFSHDLTCWDGTGGCPVCGGTVVWSS